MIFHIKVFRFYAGNDYNECYQKLDISIDEALSLKDLMNEVKKSLLDFAYDEQSFGFRINGKVVFSNVKLCDLVAEFGENLEFSSINEKYALKDLLINKDEIFNLYKQKLDKFPFLNEESKNEFKKYILINLISPLDLDDYVGDGYAMFIKWMAIHYEDNAKVLLDSIYDFKDGIINHIATKDLIFPSDNSIDAEIEALQRELFKLKLPYITKLKKENASKYRTIKDI